VLAGIALTAGCGGAKQHGLVSIGAGLEGPSGLTATVYARGIPHAAAFAFDTQGNLWVAGSGATDHTADGIYVVRKAGGAPVKVVARIHGPLGLVWVKGSLYVSWLGGVTRFSDLQGNRFGRRTEILAGPAKGAENNNIVLAPGGRLLMGITSTCDHCVPASAYAGSIVSFRTDGSDVELYAKRIRAPYGVVVFRGDVFATMNERDDLGTRTPGDHLGLVRQGQDWGFPACYGQGGKVCAGAPTPVATLDPHAAVGGVVVATTQLGGRFATSAIVPEWNLAKVQRVALTKTSSGYKGSVAAFLTGFQHPLPVAFTSGGALLVGDWGSGLIYRIAGG
jgi:glucose/arabinose dehydrogenase